MWPFLQRLSWHWNWAFHNILTANCWETKDIVSSFMFWGLAIFWVGSQWMVCDKCCCCEWAVIASYHQDNRCPPLLCSPGAACRRCCVCCTGSESGAGRSPGVRTGRDRHRTGPRPPPHPPGLTHSTNAGRRRGSYSGAWKRKKCW